MTNSGSCSVVILISVCYILCLVYPCSGGELISHNCSRGGHYSSDSTYKFNLDNLLGNISSSPPPKSGFYETTVGTGADQVYGSYLCQGNLTPQNCSNCVQHAIKGILNNCSNQIKAEIWYDECMLLYSDEPFFGKPQIDYMSWCNPNGFPTTQVGQLETVLNKTLTALAVQAAGDQTPGMKFATRQVNLTFNGSSSMYTLAQCVPDLSPDMCNQCLNLGIAGLLDWCPGSWGGRTISSSCIVHYEMVRFYADDQAPALAPAPSPISECSANEGAPIPTTEQVHKRKRQPHVLEIAGISTITSVAAVVMLLTLGMWCHLRNRKALNDLEDIDMEEITTAELLQMDFNKVRAATQNFAPDKKLGEGGFGEVYKGKLENGQEIAVKRLNTSNSGQGAAEFKNEVVLIAKLQHRNLVKLLGFCLSGKEKIIAYEYLPNSSLDKLLFDPIKRASLNWETRFNIICGIAKGLLYLHEDSRLRIIHRDLKSSNILLDEAMNPKISDFGIAKTLALDQTRDSTGTLVGTYAYMAPEYLLTGQYSLKTDIYSFGIIVLETVTGQRNRSHCGPLLDEALLHRAWRLWTENAELEMVDSALNEAYTAQEAIKCIHIGLLCIQEDAGKRPRMDSVVAALSGKSIDLPPPTPPKFFNISSYSSTPMASTSVTFITKTTDTTQASLPPNSIG